MLDKISGNLSNQGSGTKLFWQFIVKKEGRKKKKRKTGQREGGKGKEGRQEGRKEGSKSEREKQIPYANTYIWNLKKKKKWSWRTQGQDGNKVTDLLENGLEDTGKGKGKLGQSERVAWTYIHYQT